MLFAEQLRLVSEDQWQRFYLPYGQLKALMRQYSAASDSECSDLSRRMQTLIDDFTAALEGMHAEENNLLQAKLIKARSVVNTQSVKSSNCSQLLALATHVERLKYFVQLNRTAIDKSIAHAGKLDLTLNVDQATEKLSELARSLAELARRSRMLMAKLPVRPNAQEELKRQREEANKGEDEPESEPHVDSFDFEEFPTGVSTMMVNMGIGSLGQPIAVPVIVVRGARAGPVLGLTACVHGNELNGIPLIHSVLQSVHADSLLGTLIAVPVVNVEGFAAGTRSYVDGTDLNRTMPGRECGTSPQQFAHMFVTKILRQCEYLIDLHTASHRRANSLYVRADLADARTRRIAVRLQPQIVVHSSSPHGSVRGAAEAMGVTAVTLEMGNAGVFQPWMIERGLEGTLSVMHALNMLLGEKRTTPVLTAHLNISRPDKEPSEDATVLKKKKTTEAPVVCTSSRWIFSSHGGLLHVYPKVASCVKAGDVLARVVDVFGHEVAQYTAEESAVVVGVSVDPVCRSGDRILHLGSVGDAFHSDTHDGHE